MVVTTMFWSHSWAVFSISLCVLISIVFLLACCICWERKKEKSVQQFYVLDENGLNKTKVSEVPTNNPFAGLSMFRRLSSGVIGANSSESVNRQTVFTSSWPAMGDREMSRDLMDSNEVLDRFNKSTLEISASSQENLDNDDAYSCISSDSRNTFYSTYPGLPRRLSRASTFVSIDFEAEKLLQ